MSVLQNEPVKASTVCLLSRASPALYGGLDDLDDDWLCWWMASGPAWHCHVCPLPSAHVTLGMARGHLQHWEVSAWRSIMRLRNLLEGSFSTLFWQRIISCILLLLREGFGSTTEMDISPNAHLLLSSFPFSYLLCKMLGSIFVYGQQIIPTSWKGKGRKFQMSTQIWLIWLIVGLYKLVLSTWDRFSDKKTWIGTEENAAVQKVLHVISKITLKQ